LAASNPYPLFARAPQTLYATSRQSVAFSLCNGSDPSGSSKINDRLKSANMSRLEVNLGEEVV